MHPELKLSAHPAIDHATVVDLLRWRAAHQPDRLGYTFLANGEDEEISYTYGELDREARVIGALLQSMARPGERALLLYPSGLKFIEAFFGCLYSGVIAVPVYPPDPARLDLTLLRFRAITANARPAVALTTSAIFSRFKELIAKDPTFSAVRWVVTDELDTDYADAWQSPAIDGDSLAFLQYTSGSTSTPKGVMVSHANLLHNEQTIQRACGHTDESTFAGWLPLYHDMGLIGNVLQPLYIGARCVLMSPVAFLQRPFRWLEAISRYKAATSGGPNFAYDLCVRKTTPEQRASIDLSSWTTAFNGAEPIRIDSLERFAKAFAVAGFNPEAFFPCYGLAEATLIVSGSKRNKLPVTYAVQAEALEHNRLVPAAAEEDSRMLIGCGAVLGDQKIAIVEPESLKRCGPGEVGEIWLSGPSVAHGYWQQPEQTEQTFNAHIAESGEGPFLRTGDLGCYVGDELYITGRLKDLIIIRGRNHYPQDIELSVERSHPALRPGCGAAFSIDADGEERLVIVHEVEYREQPDLNEVIEKIRATVFENHDLQPYAITVIKSGRIPKTSSGKIQRHACRAKFLDGTLDVLSESRIASTSDDVETPNEFVPERNADAVRAWLASQVARKLGVKPGDLDLDKPLVRYGLDSLAVIEHVHHIETVLGISLPMVLLLQDSSINQLTAEILKELDQPSSRAELTSQSAEPANGEHELSYGQKSMWFLQQMNPGPQGHIASAVKINADLDIDALRRAFQKLVDRQASLRTSFASRHGQPVQVISEHVDFDISYRDAREWTEARLDDELAAEINREFELDHAPLLRVNLYKRSEQSHILLLVVHHIVADFWSLSVLLNELGQFYSSAASLPPLKASYVDYVQRQNALLNLSGEEHWNYWQRKLSGELPTLNLLTDHPRPPVQTFHGASQSFKLDAKLSDALKSLSQAHDVTLYTTLLSAFQTLLFRYTHQEDIIVGSPTVGRNSADFAGLVGYFVNPIAIRTDLAGNPSFATLLGRVRETVLDAFAHQDYPFALLVERLQPVRDPGFSPIFQTMFALQKSHLLHDAGLSPFALGESGRRVRLGELALESFALKKRATQFDLTLLIAEADNELFASFEYNSDLFDATTVARMAENFTTLLRGIVDDPQQQLARLPLLTNAEQQQLVSTWNQTRVENAAEAFVHRLFEEQVTLRPDATAIVCEGESATYEELNTRANQLAHRLRNLGVKPECIVGILMGRSINFVAGLLGILKAGGAYLPLDPEYPRERLAAMIDNAGLTALLTEEKYAALISECDLPVLKLDTEWDAIARESKENPTTHVAAKNPVYVIYTSGSTGKAKGVQISHESLANLIFWHQREYNISHTDRATLLAGISFDASVWELWPYLVSGASLHLPDDETRNSPVQLRDWLITNQISVSFVPTPLAESMLALDWPTDAELRVMLTGGDALRRYPPASLPFELVNHYGPTESTVVATSCRLSAVHDASAAPSIGRPIANTNIYLLDSDLQLVPVGVAGEIYIGGLSLARGYLNDPAQTADRFIPSPFDNEPGVRLYRTGDLARYLPDGNIEFLGRTDHQVKIRGFRVELGDIEVSLRQHPNVSDAVVMAQRNGRGENQLVAYVVTQNQTLKHGALREFLKERLPHYMLPAAFVPLTEIPLTPNGKIDRKALPEVTQDERDTNFSTPRTPIEDVVAGIWTNVLDLERVGVHDNFFELGGHSLLATQIVSRVTDYFKVKIPLQSFFENATVAGMVQCIEDAVRNELAVKSPPMLPASRNGALPVSFAQQRLWFINQLDPGNPAYNCPASVSLTGVLDVKALQSCFNFLIARHEPLRTTFVAIDGLPHQVVHEPAPLAITVLDLQAFQPEQQPREVARITALESQTRFDLQHGPLLRVTLLRLGEQQHVLLLTLHHIISDAWSVGVLIREVAQLYEDFREGRVAELPELSIQYGDFAVWQREWLQGEELERQMKYWREQLSGMKDVLELPQAKARTAQANHHGATVELKLDQNLTRGLRELSREQGVTLYMLLLAAFKLLLYRYSDDEEVVVGTGIANRNRVETEGLIGFFVNMLVLRTQVAGELSFTELLQRVREVCIGAYAHQDVPFEKLVEELQPDRSVNHPLFQVMMLLQNAPISEFHLEGLKLEWAPVPTPTAKFDLTVDLEERDGMIDGRLEYNVDRFEESSIRRMVDHLDHLLRQVVENPEQKLSELSLLTEAEADQILREWNGARVSYADECIHERFEAQAEQTPDAIALISGDEEVSYRELNSRANRLANYLRRYGVGAEVRVGICFERSVNAVVSMLAIFKAGGAYVPLDPTYPAERLDFVRSDAQVSLLITEERFAATLDLDAEVLLDRDWPSILAESDDQPPTEVSSDNVAYIVYTSGSTGRPKGVMSLHRGGMNRFQWMWRTYPFAADEVCCQKTSLGFADSVWEIFGPMLQGVPSVIIPNEIAKDPRELNRILAHKHVTRIVLVPSLLRAMLDDLSGLTNPLPDLKLWVSSGEALPLDLCEKFKEIFPDRLLLNLYGSSEVSADSTSHEVDELTRNVLIGKPIDNTQVYLLDEHLRLAPMGVPAELYIGGDGLARGYLLQPSLTAARFIPNPFSAEPGGRLYRTGDLARWTDDGNLEYVGRSDHQVKIRGVRVELGEVEGALNRHPEVKQAVVNVLEEEPGEKRLVAYVVSSNGAPNISKVRSFMRKELPEHMVPSAFVVMENLPMTTSGKVDRLSLPRPLEVRPELDTAYTPPRTQVEGELVAIWSELLRTEQIGVDDNFFDLGGHSLMATQLLSRVRLHFDVDVVLQEFFKSPTIAEMGQLIEAEIIAKSNQENLDEMLELLDHLDDADLPATLVLDDCT